MSTGRVLLSFTVVCLLPPLLVSLVVTLLRWVSSQLTPLAEPWSGTMFHQGREVAMALKMAMWPAPGLAKVEVQPGLMRHVQSCP